MEMSTGIRRRNVSSRSVSGFVVAPMSMKREVRGVLSPTRRNTPVSSREKNISCPVDDRPWISSRNRMPPFACSTRPGLSSSAPVNAPFL